MASPFPKSGQVPSRNPYHHESATNPYESQNPPNLSLNCFGNRLCKTPFEPLPKKKSTFFVPDAAYQQPLKSRVKIGTINTLMGPVDDIVSTLPGPQGNYRNSFASRKMTALNGNQNLLRRRKEVSGDTFCKPDDPRYNFVQKGMYQNAIKRANETENLLLDDLRPASTGVHETLYDRSAEGGHSMARLKPGMAYVDHLTFEKKFNDQHEVQQPMMRKNKFQCYNGEVRTDDMKNRQGLVKRKFEHTTAGHAKGSKTVEVINNRRQQQVDVLKHGDKNGVSGIESNSETSTRVNRREMDVKKATSTDVTSNQFQNTGTRTKRFGNLQMTKKNPLYNHKVRNNKRQAKRHHGNIEFQNNVSAPSNASNSVSNRQVYNKALDLTNRKGVPSITSAFRGAPMDTKHAVFADASSEQSFDFQANPLYYPKRSQRGQEDGNGAAQKGENKHDMSRNQRVYPTGVKYGFESQTLQCN